MASQKTVANKKSGFCRFLGDPRVRGGIEVVAILLAVVGFLLTIQSVNQNTQSMKSGIRAQLYEGDRVLNEREFQNPWLNVAYLDKAEWKKSPHQYARKRLEGEFPSLVKNAEQVTLDLLDGISAGEFPEGVAVEAPQETERLRKLTSHMEAWLYHLEAAYDYRNEGIIAEGEWKTWKGWLKQMGPHPVLLMVIRSGIENKYICREFASELYKTMVAEMPENVPVIGDLYPEFLVIDYSSLPSAKE